ncbi:hypothetical protein IAQ67_28895 (plasmid) [Paenibacillus peoriae]|uniref:Uncharacterized protein n=1 Tax=Paenibacillus peoriae TaxID=59893 RepID=A0A7H0YH18_9BACL|nr:hypothetical protein [Paenibacillus peoriae]QNR70376.1 hypothetical protein IAQ67_28895 [Paenibacillus peoriae]
MSIDPEYEATGYLPSYYGLFVGFRQEGGRYYMDTSDYSSGTSEVSKEFYEVAVKEFNSGRFND